MVDIKDRMSELKYTKKKEEKSRVTAKSSSHVMFMKAERSVSSLSGLVYLPATKPACVTCVLLVCLH